MTLATAVNWTTVLVSLITTIPAIITALLVLANRRSLKTPSGDSIGHVVERTHDLAALSTLAVAGVTATGPMQDAGRRLNASADAPVKVNGEILPDAGPPSAPPGAAP